MASSPVWTDGLDTRFPRNLELFIHDFLNATPTALSTPKSLPLPRAGAEEGQCSAQPATIQIQARKTRCSFSRRYVDCSVRACAGHTGIVNGDGMLVGEIIDPRQGGNVVPWDGTCLCTGGLEMAGWVVLGGNV